jgi:hypothetical protein
MEINAETQPGTPEWYAENPIPEEDLQEHHRDAPFAGVGLDHNEEGWTVHTHRAEWPDRYPSPDQIPDHAIEFIRSTGHKLAHGGGDDPTIRHTESMKIAHGGGDDPTIRHCPFCLSGDTLILTRNGEVPIEEVAGTRQFVLTGEGFDRKAGFWIEAEIRSFGEQPLWKITLTRNQRKKIIRATANHRWFVRSGPQRSQHREVTTDLLRPGYRLSFLLPKSGLDDVVPSPLGIAHGVVFGDGNELKWPTGRATEIKLWGEKDVQLLRYFPESIRTKPCKTPNGVLGIRVSGLPAGWKTYPDIEQDGPDYLYGWLAGYFAADGDVSKQGQVTLTSSRREHLEFAQVLAHRLGIATFGIRTKMRRGYLSEPGPIHSLEFVGSTLRSSFFLIHKHRSRYDTRDYGFERLGWVVQSIEPIADVEEVFCAVVPSTASFVLSDYIWTHNCGSGQVVARSDGTTECQFCGSYFEVSMQPEFANMPQTDPATGLPIPGTETEEDGELPPAVDPGVTADAEGVFVPPGDEDVAMGGTDGVFIPPAKEAPVVPEKKAASLITASNTAYLDRLFRTAKGHDLPEDWYVAHLAISFADDRDKVLEAVRSQS